MELVIQERPRLIVDALRPGPAERFGGGRRLSFHVLYTRVPNTAAALRCAAGLVRELGAKLTILAALSVPYPLPLTEPPVAVDFLERTLWGLALDIDVDTNVQIYLCRDPRETFRQVLAPRSTVLIGDTSPRWWPAAERRLARTLRGDGHAVFLIQPSAL